MERETDLEERERKDQARADENRARRVRMGELDEDESTVENEELSPGTEDKE